MRRWDDFVPEKEAEGKACNDRMAGARESEGGRTAKNCHSVSPTETEKTKCQCGDAVVLLKKRRKEVPEFFRF